MRSQGTVVPALTCALAGRLAAGYERLFRLPRTAGGG
jgi:hypothetical protein